MCIELSVSDLRDWLLAIAISRLLNYSSEKLIRSRLSALRFTAYSPMNLRMVPESIRWPQLLIWLNLRDCSPVNLLRASENPGRDRSGKNDKFNSLSFLMLAMSNIVSEKFLSAMFSSCKDLRFFKYLWNLISCCYISTPYGPVSIWTP